MSSESATPTIAPGVSQDEVSAAELRSSIGRFVSAFERSSRRWEFVVYPALFAFVVLATYGFFLIYSLTNDMRSMAHNINDMNVHMQEMSRNVTVMTDRVNDMSYTVSSMSGKMDALEPIQGYMGEMETSMKTLSLTNDMMRQEVAVMSRNVSRPMSAMNRMMPW